MAKFKVEYKVVRRQDGVTSTTQAKYVAETLPATLRELLEDPDIDFLTIRRVVEKPAKPITTAAVGPKK